MSFTKRAGFVVIPLVVVFVNASMIFFPQAALTAARGGLRLWLNSVLPSLLPFAIGINILSGLGLTRFAGVLLQPIMYPLFRVPGNGGFALITGLVSGSPLGAKVVADLYEDKALTLSEARRLVKFTNNCGPLFIISAVGIGMFGNRNIGYFLYAAHVLAALSVGFIFRGGKKKATEKKSGRLIPRALDEMRYARAKNKMSVGAVISASVINAMEVMLAVGGFIVLFAVIIGILGVIKITEILPGIVPEGVFTGILEVTSGTKRLAASSGKEQLVAAAGIISFGGMCIHAQSMGYLSKTDIGAGAYLSGKAVHAAVAVIFAYLLYPVYTYFNAKNGSIAEVLPVSGDPATIFISPVLNNLWMSALFFAASAAALFIVALICGAAAKAEQP